MKWYWWTAIAIIVLVGASILNKKRVLENLKKIRLGENFTADEFAVTSTGLENVPGTKKLDALKQLVANILQPLRNAVGKPIVITSGYRSPAVNAAIGGEGESQHTKGQAADFHIVGMTNQEIIDLVRRLQLPYDQIIDEQLKGSKWVHVSFNPAKAARLQWLTARDVGPNRPKKYETVKYGLA